jgi:hypothetical protein
MTPARIIRSLLPADSFQVCFVTAVVCFTIAPHLRRWPTALSPDAYEAFRAVPLTANAGMLAVALASCAFYPAATVGYFLYLWPTRRRNLWVGSLVVLPVALALAGVLIMDVRLSAPYESVLGSGLARGAGSGWKLSNFWRIGTGLH